MSTVEVTLTQGRVAMIDAEDWPLVAVYQWHAARRDKNVYAASNEAKPLGYYMHRLIAGAKPGDHVDHRNGNGLDNRRANLRICTNAENRRNMRIHRGASRYKGVALDRRQPGRPWVAYINIDGRRHSLGAYVTEIEAARAYNAAALELHGEFACLNTIEGLSHEESVTAPVRNRKPGRPFSHALARAG